ncbi:Conserved hypothetical protein [Candidatus Protochlamydia naegleriophila]|uniref:Leucine-rich repeat domain-containing protein n=1 Tax=Candidatus Protochlamydia naegleriophila TaxID=389348 RepID=A0A0U5JF72_9BACT|nr:leucine-rich repeat domain-containing protein [Candidatus Protochlamydia naegleriophila]CUI17039.1 Conserved hypothetical protein [Candidatus Protochlamydia naegleriophila]
MPFNMPVDFSHSSNQATFTSDAFSGSAARYSQSQTLYNLFPTQTLSDVRLSFENETPSFTAQQLPSSLSEENGTTKGMIKSSESFRGTNIKALLKIEAGVANIFSFAGRPFSSLGLLRKEKGAAIEQAVFCEMYLALKATKYSNSVLATICNEAENQYPGQDASGNKLSVDWKARMKLITQCITKEMKQVGGFEKLQEISKLYTCTYAPGKLALLSELIEERKNLDVIDFFKCLPLQGNAAYDEFINDEEQRPYESIKERVFMQAFLIREWMASHSNLLATVSELELTPQNRENSSLISDRINCSLGCKDYGLTTLPEEIRYLTNLTSLTIVGHPIRVLPDAFYQLSSLENLTIMCTDLEDIGNIGRLTNLGWIALNNNKLTSLPGEMAALTKLYRLSVLDNPLKSWPTFLSNLPRLAGFHLSGSLSKQPIPTELEKGYKFSYEFDSGRVVANPSEEEKEQVTCITGYKKNY